MGLESAIAWVASVWVSSRGGERRSELVIDPSIVAGAGLVVMDLLPPLSDASLRRAAAAEADVDLARSAGLAFGHVAEAAIAPDPMGERVPEDAAVYIR